MHERRTPGETVATTKATNRATKPTVPHLRVGLLSAALLLAACGGAPDAGPGSLSSTADTTSLAAAERDADEFNAMLMAKAAEAPDSADEDPPEGDAAASESDEVQADTQRGAKETYSALPGVVASTGIVGKASFLGYYAVNENYLSIKHQVGEGTSDVENGRVLAGVGITDSAMGYPLYMYYKGSNGRLSSVRYYNAYDAMWACEARLRWCQEGMKEALGIINRTIRNEMRKGTCSATGENFADVYNNYNNQGRKLLSRTNSKEFVKFVAHSSAGIAMYTGINWTFDMIEKHDKTKIANSVRQYFIWGVGLYLTSYNRENARTWSAATITAIGVTAQRAGTLARSLATSAVAAGASCIAPHIFWGSTESNGSEGIDLEAQR